ncbi:MAG: hypothetical protein ACI8X5_004080 [Planctomycetota bacterium]
MIKKHMKTLFAYPLVRRASFLALSVLSLSPSLIAGDVIVVDQYGHGDYLTIQDAVDASHAGDHILILHGDYDGFTVANKSVHISSVDGAVVRMKGTVHVLDTPSGATVTLRGLEHAYVDARSVAESAGLSTQNNAGAIRVNSCVLGGFNGFDSPLAVGALVDSSANLVFSSSTLFGASGSAGLRATGSSVAAFRTNIVGGLGSPASATGMELLGTSGEFYSSGGSIIGGTGVDGYCPEWTPESYPGDGGAGYLNEGWTANAIGTLVQGGVGGAADGSFFWCSNEDGPDGAIGIGQFGIMPGIPRSFDAPAIAQLAAGSMTLTFHGAANDQVYLKASLGADFALGSRLAGPQLLAQPFLGIIHSTTGGQSQLGGGVPITLPSFHLGQINGNGKLVVQVPLATAFSGTQLSNVHLQGFMIDGLGTPHATESVVVGLIPCSEILDCNNNGIGDVCETAGGMALDCNANLVPDECEADCNLNGIPDECDVILGTALDCNANLIPDQCENNDCNSNGVPDDCDIASAFSFDVDGNGYPDECQGLLQLYVDGAATPGGDGSTWATAYRELQDALEYQRDHPLDVGEIWVARGMYMPSTTGDRFNSFQLGSRARLRGGFAGFETNLGQRDLASNRTLLSGDLLGNDNPGGGTGNILDSLLVDNSNRVVTIVSGSSNVMLDGFTIRGGNNTGDSSSNSGIGGGILMHTAENFLISRCTIEGNAARKGGGVGFNGAYFHTVSTGDFVNCVIRNNRAGKALNDYHWGGGVYLDYTEGVRFVNCEISGNHSTQGGGAAIIQRHARETQFLACTIWGNTSSNGGGGIQTEDLLSNQAPTIVQSCVLWNNTGLVAPANPEYLWQLVGPESDFNVKRSAVDRAVLYPGFGNINMDPMVVNASMGDYRLSAGSPCIDAGRNGAIPNEDPSDLDQDGELAEELPHDLGGLVRRVDDPATVDTGSTSAPIVDMGAHEYDPGP